MEKRNLEKTRNALLSAAQKLLLECEDPSEVTSRAITSEAGVNLAMINYCFGSREALLYETFSRIQNTLQKDNTDFLKIIAGPGSPKEKLTEIYINSVRLMLSNYKFVKAVTKYSLTERRISEDHGSLPFVEAHFAGKKSRDECLLIAYELSSVHELAVLRYEEYRDKCGTDLKNDDVLREFVKKHIDRYLN